MKSVRNIPRMYATFELSECVLNSAAWSLAATNKEKKDNISAFDLAPSPVVLSKQSPHNTPYSKMAANKLFFCLHVN